MSRNIFITFAIFSIFTFGTACSTTEENAAKPSASVIAASQEATSQFSGHSFAGSAGVPLEK